MRLSRYIKIYPHEEDADYLLFYSTKKASKVLLHKSVLKSIEQGELSPSDEETLSGLGFLVADPEEEKKEMMRFIDEVNSRSRRFNAIVALNLDCNLSCRYCFEGSLKGKRYMSPETADLLIGFIEKFHLRKGRDINIDFYGGEPLLSLGLIKSISEKVMSLAGREGVSYGFNLVTNGTLLTGERAKELAAIGMKGAKITLDGPKANHDLYRPFKGGWGSFDTIVRNIKDTVDVVKIQIGGNYTRENYGDFPYLLDHFLREGLTPGKFLMVKFDPVVMTGEEVGLPDFREGCDSINEPWLFEAGLFLREEILKRGFYTPGIVPSPCAIELENDVVVNFDGTIYKCPGFIGRKGLEVGDLSTGIRDYRDSHRLDIWKREECLDCEYMPLCFGGCRYMSLLREEAIDDVDCRRSYLDACLEALIKQEIKYGLKAGQR